MLADAGRTAIAFDDEAAFTSSLEPLLPIAFRLANGMLRNRDDAQDAVQEAAAKGDSQAFYNLGLMHVEDEEPEIAEQWLAKSTDPRAAELLKQILR